MDISRLLAAPPAALTLNGRRQVSWLPGRSLMRRLPGYPVASEAQGSPVTVAGAAADWAISRHRVPFLAFSRRTVDASHKRDGSGRQTDRREADMFALRRKSDAPPPSSLTPTPWPAYTAVITFAGFPRLARRSKGAARPESDIDPLVEFEPCQEAGLLGIARMEAEFFALAGGRPVDLRTACDSIRHFRDEVVRAAEVQYVA